MNTDNYYNEWSKDIQEVTRMYHEMKKYDDLCYFPRTRDELYEVICYRYGRWLHGFEKWKCHKDYLKVPIKSFKKLYKYEVGGFAK